LEGRAFHDTVLVVQVLAILIQLGLFDFLGTLVFFHAIANEDLDVDDRSPSASRHTQRSILNVRSLLTEDRPQQLLFRGQLGFALRRYLTNQDVARAHFSTDVHHTGLIQLGQGTFTYVGNIRGDLFRPQLGITSDTGQFLNMNGGEAVFLYHPLGDQYRVLEVVAVPGHERDPHVLTQSQLTHVHRRTIRENIATTDGLTFFH